MSMRTRTTFPLTE